MQFNWWQKAPMVGFQLLLSLHSQGTYKLQKPTTNGKFSRNDTFRSTATLNYYQQRRCVENSWKIAMEIGVVLLKRFMEGGELLVCFCCTTTRISAIISLVVAVCLLGGCNAVVVAFVVLLDQAATPTHNIKYSISAFIYKWFTGEMPDIMWFAYGRCKSYRAPA